MSFSKIHYVTSYLDIDRDNWKTFARPFTEYLDCFQHLINLFDGLDPRFHMIAYIDSKHVKTVLEKVNNNPQITVVPIDKTFMNTHCPMWKTLDKERAIMASDQFKNLVPHRLRFPEHSVPEYTLINHCKIDLICHTINTIDTEYLLWIDFGYCKYEDSIPHKLLDISKLNKDRINYSLINPLDEYDKDILYTLFNAPEKISGGFFFGRNDMLIKYQKIYHSMLELYQSNNITDDDQAFVIACYFRYPEYFQLHGPWKWCRALVETSY